MAQLGKLHESYEQFQDLNCEVIVVFREEADGADGLAQSREKSGAEFPLLLDPQSEATAAYSQEGFNTYIIDSEGIVRAVLTGTKEIRPGPEEILAELEELDD